MKKTLIFAMTMTMTMAFCQVRKSQVFNIDENLNYCVAQATKTLATTSDSLAIPRNIAPGSDKWNYVGYEDWTSGFWPGILWYLYEYTGEVKWKTQADKYSRILTPLSVRSATDHDLGFQIYCSFGNGFRLTKNQEYKEIILKTADTLATLFNPKVGTIQSWPHNKMGGHNTIIDNMMNLELLFEASKISGNPKYRDVAIQHANTTLKNQFREDNSCYHVIVWFRALG